MGSHENRPSAGTLPVERGWSRRRFGNALLARDLVLVLLLKVALVAALYLFLLRPAMHPAHDPAATAAAVAGAAVPHPDEVRP
jgi:hypothetical protein